jgi:hypothetical protein
MPALLRCKPSRSLKMSEVALQQECSTRLLDYREHVLRRSMTPNSTAGYECVAFASSLRTGSYIQAMSHVRNLIVVGEDEITKRYRYADVERPDVMPPEHRQEQGVAGLEGHLTYRYVAEQRELVGSGRFRVNATVNAAVVIELVRPPR